MICPTCGAEVAATKFCENCGCSLPAAFEQDMQPVLQEAQPVAQPEPPITQSMPSAEQQAVSAGMPSAAQLPSAVGGGYVPNSGAPQPPSAASGGYAPRSGAPQPPYQQYQAAPVGNSAPNAAFVLVIVGLVLSAMFVTFLPGLICSIIGLVLNAGYNKRGLDNPRKTATLVIGIIAAVLCIVFTVFVGVITAQVVSEADRQGVNIANGSVEISTDSSGHINITGGSSSASSAASGSSAAASSASASAASSAASASSASAASTIPVTAFEEAKYHDGNWNPTLYSILELNGADFSRLLDHYNFSWDDDYGGWAASDGSLFIVNDASSGLSQSQIKALPTGAAGQPVLMGLWVEGYATPADAFAGLTSDVVVEERYASNGLIAALVHGTPMARYLVFVQNAGDNEQMVLIWTEEAISSGFFDSFIGESIGSTVDEVWRAITNDSHIGDAISG